MPQALDDMVHSEQSERLMLGGNFRKLNPADSRERSKSAKGTEATVRHDLKNISSNQQTI
jgi:hypothetical protein